MTLNDAAAFITIVSGAIGLILMGATLFYTIAIFRGWKPRPWAWPNVTYILPSKRMVTAFGALGLGLLVSSWVMYEWPRKTPEPKITTKTITKTVTVKVPTADPVQAAEIDRLDRELKAAKIAAIPHKVGQQAAMVTGNGSSANSNYEFGTDRPLVAGNNSHATGNTVVATPMPPSLVQQQLNQKKAVIEEIRQQYFAEHKDTGGQSEPPVDYVNAELKKRNLNWTVTSFNAVAYTIHAPQQADLPAVFGPGGLGP